MGDVGSYFYSPSVLAEGQSIILVLQISVGNVGEKHPIFKTMDEIEALISPDQFYRISRQMIINRKATKG